MKNIFKIIILLIGFQINAQTIKAAEDFYVSDNFKTDNVYFKDLNHIYDKFLGTWEYNSGMHNLKVIVSKITRQEQGVSYGNRLRKRRQYLDLIKCEYIYKYNGVIVYNVITPYQVINGKVISSSIVGHVINNPNQVELAYNEPSTTDCDRNRFGRLKLSYISNTIPQLQWIRTDKLINWPDSHCTNGEFDVSEYKIPSNLTLNKVN